MTDVANIAVVGASGKMGRGIALLMLQKLSFSQKGSHPHLKLIDVNEQSFPGLKAYLKTHMTRFSERNILKVREYYADEEEIVSNSDAIDAFVHRALMMVNCSTEISHVSKADWVFEAAFEEIPIKTALLKSISGLTSGWVFSNTSSIPIHLLAEESGLKGHLIGFHFYNPPPVQKLLEIIPSKYTAPELKDLAFKLSMELEKQPVLSADVAGFIGNGHFSREILFACQMAKEESIPFVDQMTRKFLLRPMGIFQLLDYVGLSIATHLLTIMRAHLPDPTFDAPLVTALYEAGIRGGQNADGAQLDGIFRYEKGEPVAVFSLHEKKYVPLQNIDMGPVPLNLDWKRALKEKTPLAPYFEALRKEESSGAKAACRFLTASKAIEEKLVQDRVAASLKDVGIVLKEGFHHLYAPHEVW
jgi:3-hydroxyacyl-CoA dehydrogenase